VYSAFSVCPSIGYPLRVIGNQL
ncbi:hypothetical protein A2U01_0114445, partial [Trifolium medium]|nr:hypothetical protein [Trifolium medium]